MPDVETIDVDDAAAVVSTKLNYPTFLLKHDDESYHLDCSALPYTWNVK
jgi:hypothetical protein